MTCRPTKQRNILNCQTRSRAVATISPLTAFVVRLPAQYCARAGFRQQRKQVRFACIHSHSQLIRNAGKEHSKQARSTQTRPIRKDAHKTALSDATACSEKQIQYRKIQAFVSHENPKLYLRIHSHNSSPHRKYCETQCLQVFDPSICEEPAFLQFHQNSSLVSLFDHNLR